MEIKTKNLKKYFNEIQLRNTERASERLKKENTC